jgi:putative inorganic carbon (HCO3(-)) transporter
MMAVASEYIAKMGGDENPRVAVLIAAFAASAAALFVCRPSLFIAASFVLLMLVALLRFDFFVYGLVFLLPWSPLVDWDFPVRNVFVVLRFVLFLGVWVRLRKNNKSIARWLFGNLGKRGIAVFAGITVASVALSSVPSNVPAYRALAFLASYLATFYAIDGWLQDRTKLVRVLKILLLSTIGVALFGFYQAIDGSYTDIYFRLYPFHEESLEPWVGRITSFLFHFNSLAGYLNLVIPFAVACAVLARDRALQVLGLACACAAAVAVVLTQSRGGILALAGVLVIGVWLLVPRLVARIAICCGGALVCLFLLPPLLNHFDRLQGVDEFTQDTRLAAWQAAVIMFLDHPLLGVGYGNYRFLSANFVPGAEPGKVESHNLYLGSLAETGLIGFLAFFALLRAFLLLSLRSMRGQDGLSRIVAFGVCGAITATLIHGAVDYLFNISPQFGTLFWLVLGLGSCAMMRATSEAIPGTAADVDRNLFNTSDCPVRDLLECSRIPTARTIR